jgi:hypothetical protein
VGNLVIRKERLTEKVVPAAIGKSENGRTEVLSCKEGAMRLRVVKITIGVRWATIGWTISGDNGDFDATLAARAQECLCLVVEWTPLYVSLDWICGMVARI